MVLRGVSVLVLDVDVKLVNVCQAERTKTLDSLVQQCSIPPYSCTQCSDHLRDATNHPYPCKVVQQVFRLLQHEFDNVTATCLKDCRSFASKSLPDCIMLAGAYSTTLKSVGSKLESVQQWVDQSHYLPLYASGDRPVFGHVGNVAEAVIYFDGDGGFINVDRFPGLRRYLEVSGVNILKRILQGK
ncbi:hypothetical protein EMCRGX_G003821 [Ephydatia muelleri]